MDDEFRTMRDLSISKVHEHLAALRRMRNSLVSPLCRMPYEIIAKIVSFVPDPSDGDEHSSLLIAKSGPICNHVWSILKDTPKFWGHVDFNQRDSLTNLFRCRGRPSRLWIRYGPSETRNSWTTSTLYNWFAIAAPSVELLEEFRFYGTPSDFDIYRWIFANPLPLLHTLTVVSGRIQYSWVPEIIETWAISGQFPAGLRSVTLKQVLIPWETLLTSHLVDLDLDYSQTSEGLPIFMSTFVELLSLCSRLETLRLFCAGPETQDDNLAHTPGANPAHLTSLRVFEISDDALNIAYIMNHLKFPDATHIHIEPSIDFPEHLVSFTLPGLTRISPFEGLVRWSAGQESTLSLGNTKFTYHMDVDDEEFMETFMFTFDAPFVEFAGFSACALTALELDFDHEFEPRQIVWFTVLASLPALQRLSCSSTPFASRYFAPKFFAELGKGSQGEIHCPKLKELDLSRFDIYDVDLVSVILLALYRRDKAGFPVQKFSSSKSFESSELDVFRRRASAMESPKVLDREVLG
jgi:hypothetical protein